MRKAYIFIGVLLILFVAIRFAGGGASSSGRTAPEVGSIAPHFTLASLSGEEVALNDHRGKVVLINFWATWCPPCRQEMPGIMAAYEEHQDEMTVLAVDNNESADLVQGFVEFLGFDIFDPLMDPGANVADLYNVNSFPTSFFVDEDGVIRYVHIGLMTENQLNTYLTQMGVGQ